MRLEGFSKLLAWAVFLSALSCSSADPPAPPQGCQDFIDIWCNKNAECRPPSDRARSVEDCEFTAKLEIDCSQTRALAPTYDSCLGDIEQSSCTAYVEGKGLPLPATCKGILLR